VPVHFLLRRLMPTGGSACYFFIFIIIVIGHETTTTARWALLLIVRTLFNDAITVALWTGFGFHVCLPVRLRRAGYSFRRQLRLSAVVWRQRDPFEVIDRERHGHAQGSPSARVSLAKE
jgi:hypothetical protein